MMSSAPHYQEFLDSFAKSAGIEFANESQKRWDEYFLGIADAVKNKSKDPSTKVGAVLVGPNHVILGSGFNGFPMGMYDDPTLYENRDEKYSRVIHAEMNALLFATRPISEGATLYCTLMPCDRCVVHLLQAGVRRFVAPQATEEQLTRWAEAFEKTQKYIKECGGELVVYPRLAA